MIKFSYKMSISSSISPSTYNIDPPIPSPEDRRFSSVVFHGAQLSDPKLTIQLYCCENYAPFKALSDLETTMDDLEIQDEVIDITPHAPFVSKTARKAAKGRTSERLPEREVERQRVAVQHANVFSFAKQMKTIQCALSSSKYWEEGWILNPSTPLLPAPKQNHEEFRAKIDVLFVYIYKIMMIMLK